MLSILSADYTAVTNTKYLLCGVYYIPLEKTDNKNINKNTISGAIKIEQEADIDC